MKNKRIFNGKIFVVAGTRSVRWAAANVAQRIRSRGGEAYITPIGPTGVLTPEEGVVDFGYAIWVPENEQANKDTESLVTTKTA